MTPRLPVAIVDGANTAEEAKSRVRNSHIIVYSNQCLEAVEESQADDNDWNSVVESSDRVDSLGMNEDMEDDVPVVFVLKGRRSIKIQVDQESIGDVDFEDYEYFLREEVGRHFPSYDIDIVLGNGDVSFDVSFDPDCLENHELVHQCIDAAFAKVLSQA